MANGPNVTYPIRISRLAHHYYVYSPDHISILRREYNIPGTLIGTLPQSPQQNLFLGLPLELLPEEALLLIERGVANIVDDSEVHRNGLRQLVKEERKSYVRFLDSQGHELERAASKLALAKKERALNKLPEAKRERLQQVIDSAKQGRQSLPEFEYSGPAQQENDDNPEPPTTRQSSAAGSENVPATPSDSSPGASRGMETYEMTRRRRLYHITPTLTDPLFQTTLSLHGENRSAPSNASPTALPLSSNDFKQSASTELITVPSRSSYLLFKYLHSQSYFLSSGLRFGAQYSVYPGDPLRFHAHFLARGYDWEEEIDILSLVGGGRLGTGVKKGYLIGGPVRFETFEESANRNGNVNVGNSDTFVGARAVQADGSVPVRCFCIEWAGM